MQELINVFSDNKIIILAIVIFIFGLVLLGYLLTLILSSKKHPKKVKEEVAKENIDVKASNELEEMLDKMQKTIEKKDEMDSVDNYEFEQEESSIISYQELLAAAKKDFPQISNSVKIEPEEELNLIQEKILKEELKPEILEVEEPKENKKFKSSVFISPIYGVKEKENIAELKKDYFKTITDNKSNNVDISINNTDDLNYENEINEQFVEDLKTFRNNL